MICALAVLGGLLGLQPLAAEAMSEAEMQLELQRMVLDVRTQMRTVMRAEEPFDEPGPARDALEHAIEASGRMVVSGTAAQMGATAEKLVRLTATVFGGLGATAVLSIKDLYDVLLCARKRDADGNITLSSYWPCAAKVIIAKTLGEGIKKLTPAALKRLETMVDRWVWNANKRKGAEAHARQIRAYLKRARERLERQRRARPTAASRRGNVAGETGGETLGEPVAETGTDFVGELSGLFADLAGELVDETMRQSLSGWLTALSPPNKNMVQIKQTYATGDGRETEIAAVWDVRAKAVAIVFTTRCTGDACRDDDKLEFATVWVRAKVSTFVTDGGALRYVASIAGIDAGRPQVWASARCCGGSQVEWVPEVLDEDLPVEAVPKVEKAAKRDPCGSYYTSLKWDYEHVRDELIAQIVRRFDAERRIRTSGLEDHLRKLTAEQAALNRKIARLRSGVDLDRDPSTSRCEEMWREIEKLMDERRTYADLRNFFVARGRDASAARYQRQVDGINAQIKALEAKRETCAKEVKADKQTLEQLTARNASLLAAISKAERQISAINAAVNAELGKEVSRVQARFALTLWSLLAHLKDCNRSGKWGPLDAAMLDPAKVDPKRAAQNALRRAEDAINTAVQRITRADKPSPGDEQLAFADADLWHDACVLALETMPAADTDTRPDPWVSGIDACDRGQVRCKPEPPRLSAIPYGLVEVDEAAAAGGCAPDSACDPDDVDDGLVPWTPPAAGSDPDDATDPALVEAASSRYDHEPPPSEFGESDSTSSSGEGALSLDFAFAMNSKWRCDYTRALVIAPPPSSHDGAGASNDLGGTLGELSCEWAFSAKELQSALDEAAYQHEAAETAGQKAEAMRKTGRRELARDYDQERNKALERAEDAMAAAVEAVVTADTAYALYWTFATHANRLARGQARKPSTTVGPVVDTGYCGREIERRVAAANPAPGGTSRKGSKLTPAQQRMLMGVLGNVMRNEGRASGQGPEPDQSGGPPPDAGGGDTVPASGPSESHVDPPVQETLPGQ